MIFKRTFFTLRVSKSQTNITHLSWYLLQMTIFGKVALPIGSVDEVRLVETVAVVNCFTVLLVQWREWFSYVTLDNGWCDGDLLPAAKVCCQPSHGKDGDDPEDFHKGFGPWDMGPAMKASAATKGKENVHSEIYWNMQTHYSFELLPIIAKKNHSSSRVSDMCRLILYSIYNITYTNPVS